MDMDMDMYAVIGKMGMEQLTAATHDEEVLPNCYNLCVTSQMLGVGA